MKALRVWFGPGIGVLVLAGLLVAWHVVGQGKKAAPSSSTGLQVVNINPDDVQRLTLAAGGKTLTFVRAPAAAQKAKNAPISQWRIGSTAGPAPRPFAVSQLLFGLNPLTAERTVSIDPKAAGLEPPSQTLTLVMKDGSTTVIEIGATAPIGGNYARVRGQQTIYLLDGSLSGQITADPSAWQSSPASASTNQAPAASTTP